MLFVSMFYTYNNLSGIKFLSVKANPVFPKDEAVFEYVIYAKDTDRLSVEFGFSEDKKRKWDIVPNIENRVKATTPANMRGLLTPGPLLIFTSYPFGLFRGWSWIQFESSCIVYPQPVKGAFETAEYLDSKEGGNREGSGVDDFCGLKNYQQGDTIQHISWKASSRGQGLYTKVFCGNLGTSVMLDINRLSNNLDMEQKLSRLCYMVLKAHRMNLSYGLKIPGVNILPETGESHKAQCLKALALFGISANDIK
ncbi:MAG: DUF58 domain-containing protein [Desulfobacterales bacterium]|nr:DUF58 domain-containing protein [Desulfobacterales bacterium]